MEYIVGCWRPWFKGAVPPTRRGEPGETPAVDRTFLFEAAPEGIPALVSTPVRGKAVIRVAV